ncbi:2-keto-3-deoxy-galactonokinase [compost metagenome]
MTALIGVDWGTTRLRVMRIDAEGRVQDRRVDPRGAGTLASADFLQVLAEVAGDWLEAAPVLICGMAGARQGWTDAGYRPCPARIEDLARHVVWPEPGRRIGIVPGLALRLPELDDVMRGEETQALGLFGAGEGGLLIAPGTHSKWIEVGNGAVTALRTFLTGELFAAVRTATLLGRGMGEPGQDEAAFDQGGLQALFDPAVTANLFSVRVRHLSGVLGGEATADYLSGLLIGAEVAAGREHRDRSVMVVGEDQLAERYRRALGLAGFTHIGLASAEAATAAGLHRIWKAIP